jgi:hypothetical protein
MQEDYALYTAAYSNNNTIMAFQQHHDGVVIR